ncbi:ectonucleoside triphosphate diphosphohydrolase 8-like [Patiria miniata]|uniref:Ectonucleoside triphosphate diphosphohydrolase n=1 Tax=Patiria miniata TaxID=46514 RepID=A0A913Z5T5_PATMI|nr:ectonucleoside triphosphate diphosphohydrolase 8-like [Patiria miniata]
MPDPNKTRIVGSNKSTLLIGLGLILAVIFLIGIIVVSVEYSKWDCGEDGYGLVFDAGSSHSSMAVYQWPGDTVNGTGVLSEAAFYDECGELGISSYADNPTELQPGLKKCLDSATDVVPAISVEDTPVYLAATAGMRLLHETDPDKSDTVFAAVRETLRESPFSFEDEEKQANILSGEREGYSSWITANYLDQHLGVTPVLDSIAEALWGTPIPRRPTLGALDLGGASTQITFVPKDPSTVPDEYKAKLRLYGTDYELYTYSFLCYGANEARRRLEANLIKESNFSSPTENPCAARNHTYTVDGEYLWKAPCSTGPQALAGWGSEVTPAPDARDKRDTMDTMEYEIKGTGDGAKCQEETSKLFDVDAPCPKPPCSFNGIHSPEPYGSYKALSAYAYTMEGIGGSVDASKSDLLAARDAYCAKTYEELEALPDKMKYKITYCFQATYVAALLDAYGFEDSNWKLEFNTKISGVTLGWALGYMLDLTNRIPVEASCIGLSPGVFGALLVIFIICLLVGVVMVVLGCREKKTRKADGKGASI